MISIVTSIGTSMPIRRSCFRTVIVMSSCVTLAMRWSDWATRRRLVAMRRRLWFRMPQRFGALLRISLSVTGCSQLLASGRKPCGLRNRTARDASLRVQGVDWLALDVTDDYSVVISNSFRTVLRFRAVVGTPSNLSAFAASFERPIPSGACR